MTLSSAQRGDPVEGWNDCPPMMMNANSSSASVNKSKKRAQRVGHNINVNNSSSSTSNSSTSLLALGMALTPSRSDMPPSTPVKFPPEGMASASGSPLATKGTTTATVAETGLETETTVDVQLLLQTLFLAKSLLLDREHSHYVKKLLDIYSTLESRHQVFLVSILQKVSAAVGSQTQSQIAAIKGDVVQYMILNDGVSGWCIPLRKIVETISV